MSKWLLIAAAGLLVACSGMSVRQDFVPGSDFGRYRAYDWVPAPAGAPSQDPLVERRLRSALESGLQAKGFRKVDAAEADFFVGYHLTVNEQTDLRTVNEYWGPEWRYRGIYGPMYSMPMSTRTETVRYNVGTLIVDFFDAADHELVWRGTADGRISEQSDPAARQKRADEAVQKILEQFPPKG